MDYDNIVFNISAFVAGLFMLEYGADAFVDNTAILAKRLGVSEVLIALLTAGAEWEELAVVVAALIQHRPGLALGNVVGSCTSNILGAFSIGLLFQAGVTRFDRSSKIYTALLFGVTSIVGALALLNVLGQVVGGLLVAAFVLYVGAVGWSIYRGVLAAPEDSDSDTDSDTTSDGGAFPEHVQDNNQNGGSAEANEESPLLPLLERRERSIWSSTLKLLLGFIALSLSGYILSHSSSTLASAFGISDSVFGATLLSLATTLPEKFVAVLSGARGYNGILVANTVGSNIFLLTLCLGVVLLGLEKSDAVSIRKNEIFWVWGSSFVLGAVVFLGSRRWMGVVMLAAYIAFIVLEFTLFRE